jgi:ABC-type dipeptide/oligopeptide/nickel transport system permease subunit
LGVAVMCAWALPLRTSGVAVGSPMRFLFDAVRGDLGVSASSGIDVDARVRVYVVGSVALGVAAFLIAHGFSDVWLRWRGARLGGHAGLAIVVAIPITVGAIERWADAIPEGARLGASVLDRGVALVVPAFTLGAALAWVRIRRDGDGRVRSSLARDWPTMILGVFVTEVAFGRPGIATLALDAIADRDTRLLQGVVLVVGIALAARARFGTPPRAERAMTALRALPCVALVSAVFVAGIVLTDVLGLPDPAAAHVRGSGAGPAVGTWLGGDIEGRDILARTLDAGRGSLAMAGAGVAIALFFALVVGAGVGVSNGRVEGALRAALRAQVAAPMFALALLAVGERSPEVVAVALAASVVLALAQPIADAIDRSLRTHSATPTRELAWPLLSVAISALGSLITLEVIFGLLGLGPDGGATLGKEIAAQLEWAGQAPLAVIGPCLFASTLGWSLGALGHGVAAASTGRLERQAHSKS